MTPDVPFSDASLLVLTATLGNSPWLEASVASVRQHAGPSVAHVLVAPDDRVTALQRRYPQCVVASETERGGLYGALNRGLDFASAWRWKWMTFIADDDLLLAGFADLRRQAETEGEGGRATVWHGQVWMLDEKGRRLCRVPYARSERDIAPLVAAGYSPFNQQGMLYSRPAVTLAGRFDPALSICADASHWLRALERGARFRSSAVAVGAFRVRQGQLSGRIDLHREEFGGLRQRALTLTGGRPLWPAVLRFRLFNLPLYAERFRRVGFKTGFGLLGEQHA